MARSSRRVLSPAAAGQLGACASHRQMTKTTTCRPLPRCVPSPALKPFNCLLHLLGVKLLGGDTYDEACAHDHAGYLRPHQGLCVYAAEGSGCAGIPAVRVRYWACEAYASDQGACASLWRRSLFAFHQYTLDGARARCSTLSSAIPERSQSVTSAHCPWSSVDSPLRMHWRTK